MRLRKLISTHELIWQGVDDALHFRIEIFEEQGESCPKLFGRVFRCDTYKVLPTWIQSDPSRSPQTADESWFVLDGMFDGVELTSVDAKMAIDEMTNFIKKQFQRT